ncbi:DUF3859 domain-containing protein [Spirosoma sp. HMF4905]|uniref:DUF3859 domain-containing protein n=1 Tax=Spirosoma arboris TaxID=2682092 RepID=A0A7K1SLV3_9BACT|nr:DUF3859 domain-containing protein [Spirosoma arboris]MVM34566.1 DUF3859 domain-containing protein [Spirosoma arboris]
MGAHARLINYGICKPIMESVNESPVSPTGYYFGADDLIFIEKVDRVKLRKGLVFGIAYSLESSQDAFLCRVIHPTLVNPGEEKAYKETIEEKYNSANGLNFDYYRIEHAWEMIDGKWVFQLEQSGKVLLEKSFELYN